MSINYALILCISDPKTFCPDTHPHPIGNGSACCSTLLKHNTTCYDDSVGKYLHFKSNVTCCPRANITSCHNKNGDVVKSCTRNPKNPGNHTLF